MAKTPIYLFSPNRIDHKSQRDTDQEAHMCLMFVFDGVEDHGIPPGGPPPVASFNPVRWNPTKDSPPGNFCHIPSGRTQQECPMHTAGMLRDRGQAISLSQQRFSCCLPQCRVQCLSNLMGSSFLCLATVSLARRASPALFASALPGK